MRPPAYWWVARFVQCALVFAVGLAFSAALVVGLWPPFYAWLAYDEWQWMPFTRWLRYVVAGGLFGVMVGGLWTTYEWLVQTPSSSLTKTMVIAAAGFVYVFLLSSLPKYLLQFLPG